MTVAVGFVFDEGYLFCVDTKISTTVKTNESKIIHYRYADGACATTFAISSDDLNFPRSACESCYEAVNKINFATATIESVRKAIQSALGKFYKEHIFPHPDRSTGGLYIEMLVGIWLKHETRVFLSHETLLNSVDEYECIGSGAYLAKYLIRQYRKTNSRDPYFTLDFQDAAFIASVAVESAIGYDEGCGGEAEMIIAKNTGEVDSIADSVLYPGDGLAKSLQQRTWKLLHDLAHLKGNKEIESAEALENYFDEVRNIHHESSRWTFKMFEDKDNS
jgi:20S proteasome alpha/beta subunit